MVTSGDWKQIEYPKANRVRLYIVRREPEELVDLSDVEEHGAVVQRLSDELLRLQQELDDPLRLPADAEAKGSGRPTPAVPTD